MCHCVCVTLWVSLEGGGLCPTCFHWSCSPSPLPPIPWVLTVPKGGLFMAPSQCPVWPWEGVLEQVALPHPSPFSESPLPFLSTLQ